MILYQFGDITNTIVNFFSGTVDAVLEVKDFITFVGDFLVSSFSIVPEPFRTIIGSFIVVIIATLILKAVL